MPPSGRLAAATFVLALVVAAGAVALLLSRTEPDGAPEAPASEVAANPTPRITALDEQLEEVARLVAEVRELPFDTLPEPTYLDPDELAQRTTLFLEDYTEDEAVQDARILAALGAIPAGMDLRAALGAALAEQVAGFYDPRTGELVVATTVRGEALPPLDELTLAHELQHALADQAFGLPDEDPEAGREDAALALQALIEGDATYTMFLYAQQALTESEMANLAEEAAELAGQSEVLAALPHYLQRSLIFPYEEGLVFVVEVQREGGWQRIDEAYRQPPSTTLQILRPDLFLAGSGGGEDPEDPTHPGAPWNREVQLAFGAADLLFLFEAPGDDPSRAIPDSGSIATTWRGGELALWTDGDRTAVGVAMTGESALCEGIERWYAAAFANATRTAGPGVVRFDGPDQDAVLACAGGEVRLGIAPDLATAEAIAR